MGRLQQRPAPLTPWAKKIKAFADYMGLSWFNLKWKRRLAG
jgi:hypothetical protein